MTNPRHIPLGRIAGDLAQGRLRREFRTSWAIALLYRAPSLPLVWLSARLGLSPTTVTLLALGLAMTLPLQAAFLPLGAAGWAVAVSAALFQVLDCVDGTLARVTQTSSKRGADLDFLTDMLQWAALYLAIGILADRVLGGGWGWTALAAGAAWTRLFARMVRDTLTLRDAAQPDVPLTPAQWPVAFVEGLSGLIPFLALAGPHLGLAVWFLLIYALLDVGDAAMPLIRNGGA